MAKEQWHNWGRTVVTIVTLVFVCGITYKTIGMNTEDIDVLQVDVKVVKEDVHKLELADKDIANMAEKSLEYMVRIDKTLDTIKEKQVEQSILLDRNTVKLETLTKD